MHIWRDLFIDGECTLDGLGDVPGWDRERDSTERKVSGVKLLNETG